MKTIFVHFSRMKILLSFLFLLAFGAVLFLNWPVESQQPDRSWDVYTHIWNKRFDTWGVTNCALVSNADCVAGIGTDTAKYNHNPDGTTNDGLLTGGAWFSLGGKLLTFDVSDFPSDACFGLRGANRQPRLVSVNGVVRLVGCAYSETLEDFILLGSVTGTGSALTDLFSSFWLVWGSGRDCACDNSFSY